MSLPIDVDTLLSEKRYRKAKRRRTRKERSKIEALYLEDQHKQRFGDRSRIIRMLADAYAFEVKPQKGGIKVTIPKTFSMIEDPIQTIQIIQTFAKSIRQFRVKKIEIDQSKLEVYDLAANALLDLIATEVEMESRHKRTRIKFSGKYPTSEPVKRFIRSMGIVKHLEIKHEIAKGDETKGIRLFDRRSRHYHERIDPRKADLKSKVMTGFADHINNCLGDHNRALTAIARHKLCEYIGEILGNAEEHPGFIDWTIQGYLDNSLETPICEIAIFNFGKSIAQTLKALPAESYTRKQIDPYLILHNGRNLFGKNWRDIDLLTLIALQGHVSSKNQTTQDTRGQGTGDLIDFFQRMHKECAAHSPIAAKMAIISGGTYILFDGTYKMREVGGRGKVIAFNAANDLYDKPDSNYVKPLGPLKFPGTIISVRFPLSAASTVALGEKK